jgi:glutathione S-transferase
MVDITLFAGLAFASFAQIAVPADLVHLHAWRERMAQRPSMGS